MNGIKVTREMVAQRAGVCKQTVSCYLNKTRGVSKESADKIEAAIGELNYVPNMVARGLSQKKRCRLRSSAMIWETRITVRSSAA